VGGEPPLRFILGGDGEDPLCLIRGGDGGEDPLCLIRGGDGGDGTRDFLLCGEREWREDLRLGTGLRLRDLFTNKIHIYRHYFILKKGCAFFENCYLSKNLLN
jgi:hypothetical protein